jgi:hypothetical protein
MSAHQYKIMTFSEIMHFAKYITSVNSYFITDAPGNLIVFPLEFDENQ